MLKFLYKTKLWRFISVALVLFMETFSVKLALRSGLCSFSVMLKFINHRNVNAWCIIIHHAVRRKTEVRQQLTPCLFGLGLFVGLCSFVLHQVLPLLCLGRAGGEHHPREMRALTQESSLRHCYLCRVTENSTGQPQC